MNAEEEYRITLMPLPLPQRIEHRVSGCYAQQNPSINWNNWMWHDHVIVVAKHAERIAVREGANIEDVVIAAYLHDIAFTKMRKDDPRCDEESRRMALDMLHQEGVSEEKALDIVDNIIAPHGMQGEIPLRIEALVLSTADAMAHLTTTFYHTLFHRKYLFEEKTVEEFQEWVLQKIERDMHRKIRFEDDRRIAKPYYQRLRHHFSTLN